MGCGWHRGSTLLTKCARGRRLPNHKVQSLRRLIDVSWDAPLLESCACRWLDHFPTAVNILERLREKKKDQPNCAGED